MPQIDLNQKLIDSLKPPVGKDREIYWDAKKPGFGVVVTENGSKSYALQYRDAEGASRRVKLKGRTLAEARREATSLQGAIEDGKDPIADKRKAKLARANTLQRIVEDNYLKDHEVAGLRSIKEKAAVFKRWIFPTLGARPVAEIKRTEIRKMLKAVRAKHGPGAAANTYKALRAFFTWYALEDDDFVSPVVRGTFKVTEGDGARTLADDEIRILWQVTAENRNIYDPFVRFLLLTACRRADAAEMTWKELSPDSTEWTIPSARFKKSGKHEHSHLIPLSPAAREVLAGMKHWRSTDLIFTTGGASPIGDHTGFKNRLNKRLQAALEAEGEAVRERIVADLNTRYPGKAFQPFEWSPHSFRKTARTLLSRIRIDAEVREKCLGHIADELTEDYDHHEYKPEKKQAFEALAREIERIAGGGPGNVVPLHAARA